jgi:heptosyltransferase-2
MKNVGVLYSAPKIGDIIWQLPAVRAISDHHKQPVFFYFHNKIKLDKILESQSYIKDIRKNGFNKGVNFILDTYKLSKNFKEDQINYLYILEKTKSAAIAALISNVDNIYGYGIGSQKFFINNKKILHKNILRLSYPRQTKEFLILNGVKLNDESPFLDLSDYKINLKNKVKVNVQGKIISIAVDSLENNRIWPMNNFAKLINLIINNFNVEKLFLISLPEKKFLVDHIIKFNNFNSKIIDLSQESLDKIIDVIAQTNLFIGNDTGPTNLAAAFQIDTICIIGPTDASALKSKKIIKLTSKHYNKNRELGIKRHGDNFDKSTEEISTIKIEDVFSKIKEKLNQF